jgi:CRISPR/Cas system CMR subunit Cmr4 (Cas7 group RAMP superfamily)
VRPTNEGSRIKSVRPERQRALAVVAGQPAQADKHAHAGVTIFVDVKVVFYPAVSPSMTFCRFPVLAS